MNSNPDPDPKPDPDPELALDPDPRLLYGLFLIIKVGPGFVSDSDSLIILPVSILLSELQRLQRS